MALLPRQVCRSLGQIPQRCSSSLHTSASRRTDDDFMRIPIPVTHRSRYAEHYHSTLASDLLYMTYDHQTTVNPAQPLRPPIWDPQNPYTKRRPAPSSRASRQPTALPTTAANLVEIQSVALSIHVKDGPSSKTSIIPALQFLRAISGYHAAGLPKTHLKQAAEPGIQVTRTTKGSNSFKVRAGQPCGAKVELKGTSAYDFLETLVDYVLPRMKDWPGIVLPKTTRADILPTARSGAFSFGLPPQAMALFPQIEVNIDQYPNQHLGLQISVVSNARGEGAQNKIRALLSGLRLPFVASQ